MASFDRQHHCDSQIQKMAAIFLFKLWLPLCCIMAGAECYKPPGEFDLTMGEIEPMCTMMDEMQSSGQKVEPKPFSTDADKDGCVYFSWEQCSKGAGDPSRPCGYYEMKKCAEGGRRKKRAYLHTFRSKRQSPLDVLLGYPDEFD